MPQAWTTDFLAFAARTGGSLAKSSHLPPLSIINNTAEMMRGHSPDIGEDPWPLPRAVFHEVVAKYMPFVREANERQRTRSRSPRRDYRDRSRSRSRDNYRNRRERSPANGHYESGGYTERSRDRPAPNKEQVMSAARENSQQERRVYVGNLSYDVKWHHLKDFMRQGESPISTSK